MYTRCYRDWSSDVCSSDQRTSAGMLSDEQQEKMVPFCPDFVAELMSPSDKRPVRFRMLQAKMEEYKIGRASCRERVEIMEGEELLKKKRERIQQAIIRTTQ